MFHTIDYSLKSNKLNCYTIEYIVDNTKRYGNIKNFLTFDDDNYCVVQQLDRKPANNDYKDLDPVCKKHLNKFFLTVSYGNDYVFVSWKTISRRCVLIEIEKNISGISKELDVIISPCHNLNEHD